MFHTRASGAHTPPLAVGTAHCTSPSLVRSATLVASFLLSPTMGVKGGDIFRQCAPKSTSPRSRLGPVTRASLSTSSKRVVIWTPSPRLAGEAPASAADATLGDSLSEFAAALAATLRSAPVLHAMRAHAAMPMAMI